MNERDDFQTCTNPNAINSQLEGLQKLQKSREKNQSLWFIESMSHWIYFFASKLPSHFNSKINQEIKIIK